MKTKNQTNKQFERIIPSLGKPLDFDMDQFLRDSQKELMEYWDKERKESRHRRANDPNRCHCPHCTVIG